MKGFESTGKGVRLRAEGCGEARRGWEITECEMERLRAWLLEESKSWSEADINENWKARECVCVVKSDHKESVMHI